MPRSGTLRGNVVAFPRLVAPPKGRLQQSEFVKLAAQVEQTCPTCIVGMFTTWMSDQIKKRGGAAVSRPSVNHSPLAEKMIQLQMRAPRHAVVLERMADSFLADPSCEKGGA